MSKNTSTIRPRQPVRLMIILHSLLFHASHPNPVAYNVSKIRKLTSQLSNHRSQKSSFNFLELENKWLQIIRTFDESSHRDWNHSTKKKSFILSMFPYPSGKLHLGHLRVYTVSDAITRYQSMTGKAVLQPMGWDAFGLPAENAAIDNNQLPAKWTESNIARMKAQFDSTMLLNIDWSREIATCNPTYFKWTQWLFVQLYKAGLAYRRSSYVNWDPVDKTVLADELVDNNGRSWRSGALVERRPLRQWYFRTTAYSQSLLDGIKEIEDNEWRDTIQMQRGWLGHLDGVQMEFDLCWLDRSVNASLLDDRLTIFTRQPSLAVADLISHIDVAPGSIFFDNRFRKAQSSSKNSSSTAEQLAVCAIHPFTKRKIPMIRQPQLKLLQNIASPNLLRFRLKSNEAVVGGDIDSQQSADLLPLDSSSSLSNCDLSDERSLPDFDHFTLQTSVSESVPVPEQDLPVKLPRQPTDGTGFQRGTLQHDVDWVNTTCPQCSGPAKRETDTLDTFVDSSWYYLRYLDPNHNGQLCRPELTSSSLPVDLYVGGIEHAIRHLFYARFIAHFLYDLGLTPCREPFRRFLPIGLVMGQTFIDSVTGSFIAATDVEATISGWRHKTTLKPVKRVWDKMSKSKLNGVDPAETVDRYGRDVVRVTMLSNVGPHRERKWQEQGVVQGVINWRSKLWRLVDSLHTADSQSTCQIGPNDPLLHPPAMPGGDSETVVKSRPFLDTYLRHVTDVNTCFNETFQLSAAISRLQELTDLVRRNSTSSGGCGPVSGLYISAMTDLVIALGPIAPIWSCELWSRLTRSLRQRSDRDAIVSFLSSSYNLDEIALSQPFPQPSLIMDRIQGTYLSDYRSNANIR